MSLENWEKEIDEYIPKLILGDVTEKNAQLLASLFVLKQHFDKIDEQGATTEDKASQIEEYEVADDDSYKAWLLDSVSDELNSAEMYLDKFRETKVEDFKTMALDETRHSEMLLKIINEKYSDTDVQELKVWHHAILARIM